MNKQRVATFILYLFSFFLLWEWLRPLEESTDTEYTFIFVIYIAISLFLAFLSVKWYISCSVKLFYSLFFIQQLFYNGSFLSVQWLNEFMKDILYNMDLMFQAFFSGMTPPFRTFLFFILLWLLVYLLNYWVIQRRRVLLFLILTITYVAVLDTFSPYDASFAIVRLAVLGFFMLGFLYLERMALSENIQPNFSAYWKWIVPLFGMILASSIIGWLAPKAAPQWPDPVPYIVKYKADQEEEALSGNNVRKIGYSPNDERLGGPFVPNDAPVMKAIVQEPHYWRVESKDVYTGKGWVSSNDDFIVSDGNVSEELQWIHESVPAEERTATVEIAKEYPYQHVMYPLGLKEISGVAHQYRINEATESIYPNANEASGRFFDYMVRYSEPSFEIEKLQAVTSNEGMPREMIARYTQLPETLPARVKQLAQEITKNERNFYDKAKAIEEYFATQPFFYETEDVAVPDEHEDYVDQFLFETKKGYCDNFSTSMVVLLRSVGIPARWVKGYTAGQFVETTNDGLDVYKVTSNNAHSWVEVYFPGIGWVPFEPTIGFTNPQPFTYENEEEEAASAIDQNLEDLQPQEPENQEENEKKQEAGQKKNSSFAFSKLWIPVIAGAVSLCLVVIIFRTRKKWASFWIIARYKHKKDQDVFLQAYRALLKHLERCGYSLKKGQTLREYAKQIDRAFGTNAMSHLTSIYERALYRKDDPSEEWEESKELWENLIKKTTS